MSFVSGLDLGQVADPAALVVCEQTQGIDPTNARRTCWHYAVRAVESYPLGTPYTTVGEQVGVCEQVRDVFAGPPLAGTTLAVDHTGVGRAVFNSLQGLDIKADLRGVTNTNGERSSAEGHAYHVPKRELVGTLVRVMQAGRLKIARGLRLRSALLEQLGNFRVKQRKSGHESFEAARSADHDDIVLALMIAVWIGETAPPWNPGDLGSNSRKTASGTIPAGAFAPGRTPKQW